MRILITGGAGYNGSVLALELAAAGHTVVCLDPRGKPPGWEFWRPSKELGAHVQFIKQEASHIQDVAEQTGDVDAFVHLAFVVGGPACDKNPDKAEEVALSGTQAVLEAARDKPLIFASSDAVYGNQARGLCPETFPCAPTSLYGRLKYQCERLIAQNSGNHCLLRLPSNFGVSPKMRYNLLVHYLVAAMFHTRRIALFEGEVTRTLVHVRDTARAFRFALEHPDAVRNRVFNIAGCSLSKSDMANQIAALFGGEVLIEDDEKRSDPDKRDFTLDCQAIHRAGWQPRYHFADGLAALRHYLAATQP